MRRKVGSAASRRVRRSVLTALSLVALSGVPGLCAPWEVVTELAGAVEHVAVAPESGTAYAAVRDVGVWRSLDGGHRWEASSGIDAPPAAFGWGTAKVVPASGDTVFTTVKHLLHRSLDGGAHWQLLEAVGDLVQDAVWAHGRLYVAAGGRYGLLVSSDGGETFSQANGDLASCYGHTTMAIAVVVSPNDPGTILTTRRGCEGGTDFFRTSDGGLHWEWILFPFIAPHWMAISPHTGWLYGIHPFYLTTDPERKPVVLRSWRLDEGFQFVEVAAGTGLEDVPPRRLPQGGSPGIVPPSHVLGFDPVEPLTVYLSTVAGVYRSLDGGNHWARMADSPDEIVLSVAVSAGPPRVLLAGTEAGRIYRTELDGDDPTAVTADGAGVPLQVLLEAAYPNPFNGTTVIRYTTGTAGPVSLTVYDVAGQRVRTLMDGDLPAGAHRSLWDGRDEAGRRTGSGVYLCRLVTAGRQELIRLVQLR